MFLIPAAPSLTGALWRFLPFSDLVVALNGVIRCRTSLSAPAFLRLTVSLALSLTYVACAAFPSCRHRHPCSILILLSCALAMLMAAKPAHAQGTVSGVTITFSPTTLTVPGDTTTATSDPYPITVHAPVHFIVVPPNDQPIPITSGLNAYGFDGQHLHFRITDGLNQPVTSAYNACWDEKWALSGSGNGPLPTYIGDVLDSTGSSIDYFSSYGIPQPTNAAGDKVTGPFTHSYYITDQGGGASGGGVGCAVQVYTNVIYKTYGVVGNGF